MVTDPADVQGVVGRILSRAAEIPTPPCQPHVRGFIAFCSRYGCRALTRTRHGRVKRLSLRGESCRGSDRGTPTSPVSAVRASVLGVVAGSVRLGPAQVAWAPARHPCPPIPLAALSGSDLLRLDELAVDLRDRFVVGRLLIHALVAGLFPTATEWTIVAGPCRRCGQRHAGVELDGVPARASVAYAAGTVVVAVAPTSEVSRLGIDAEPDLVDHARVEDLRRMLGASSEPVLHRWTRVGAVLKADGRGLLIDPGAVRLRRGGAWIAGQPASYVVAEVPGPPGFLLSLAWCSVAPAGAVQTGRRTERAAGSRWSPRPLA